MTRAIDMTGRRCGHLTVSGQAPGHEKNRHIFWFCICDCGNETIVDGTFLRNGHTTSCGCQQGKRDIRHGASRRGQRSPEYKIWAGMKSRCLNERSKNFNGYGSRGITICKRWLTFENFLADMGQRPSQFHSIERVNNDGNYEPGNCVWATRDVQANNRRRRKERNVCSHGHPLTGDNLYITPNGKRRCKECYRTYLRMWFRKRSSSKDQMLGYAAV